MVESSATSYPQPTPEKAGSTFTSQIDSRTLIERLKGIQASIEDPKLLSLIRRFSLGEATLEDVSNKLMGIFRDHKLVDAYTLLYEINYKRFTIIIFNKIKYYSHLLDPTDILQDVFLSIYRYPNKFQEGKPHAFRNWTYSIIRNTIFKHLKMREPLESYMDGGLEFLADKKGQDPLSDLVNKESLKSFRKCYIFYLILYLNIYNNYLSAREKLVLHLVEVEDRRYRDASELLGIKL